MTEKPSPRYLAAEEWDHEFPDDDALDWTIGWAEVRFVFDTAARDIVLMQVRPRHGGGPWATAFDDQVEGVLDSLQALPLGQVSKE